MIFFFNFWLIFYKFKPPSDTGNLYFYINYIWLPVFFLFVFNCQWICLFLVPMTVMGTFTKPTDQTVWNKQTNWNQSIRESDRLKKQKNKKTFAFVAFVLLHAKFFVVLFFTGSVIQKITLTFFSTWNLKNSILLWYFDTKYLY